MEESSFNFFVLVASFLSTPTEKFVLDTKTRKARALYSVGEFVGLCICDGSQNYPATSWFHFNKSN